MVAKNIISFCCILVTLFLNQKVFSQVQPSFLSDYDKDWVDSVFMSMTQDQKIGQLLMPRGNYSGKPHDVPLLMEWIEKYKIGGLVFLQVVQHVRLRWLIYYSQNQTYHY
ncbi:MAG: hypothetical protein IPK25_00805 [Saprospiraceae bacterium]|nr:hypothetical protein [Saprospiraceae bacterium]